MRFGAFSSQQAHKLKKFPNQPIYIGDHFLPFFVFGYNTSIIVYALYKYTLWLFSCLEKLVNVSSVPFSFVFTFFVCLWSLTFYQGQRLAITTTLINQTSELNQASDLLQGALR